MHTNGPCMAIWQRRAKLRRPAFVGLLLLATTTLPARGAGEDPGLASAKALFMRYQALERSFDPALADLYADDAVIRVKRVYVNGVVRQLKVPAKLYKPALRQSAATAREQDDVNEYSGVRYRRDGERVRIDAQRYSVWQHYRSPWSLWVAPDAGGRWLIREEVLEQHLSVPAHGEEPKNP